MKSWVRPCLGEGLNSHAAEKESAAGQAEGSGTGAVEEGESDEPIPHWGVYENCSTKLLEAGKRRSAAASPETVSAESCEVPTELDLGRDASYEVFSTPPDAPCPAALTKDQWEALLLRARQEKDLVCTAVELSPDGICLTFTCQADHSFTVKSSEEFNCPKCESIMAKCSEYAKSHNGNIFFYSLGKLLNEKYDEYMRFECRNKHVWKVKYSN